MDGLLSPDRLWFPVRHLRDGLDFGRFPTDVRVAMGVFGAGRDLARVTGAPRAAMEGYCREAGQVTAEYRPRWAAERGQRLDEFLWAACEALYATVRAVRPAEMVETGVQRGVSSAYLLAAMERNGTGHLTSIDLPTFDRAGRVNRDGFVDDSSVAGPDAVGDLVAPGLRRRWTLRLGDARELLPPLLDELGTIDAFFHDSEHSYDQMSFEFAAAWPHLRDGGCLISDDIAWSDPARRAWREFVAAHPGPACVYFSSIGNRGMLRKVAGAAGPSGDGSRRDAFK